MYVYIQGGNTTIPERTAEGEEIVEEDDREQKNKEGRRNKWVLATSAYSR